MIASAVQYVDLMSGNFSLEALVDLGAEMAVLRESAVPDSAKHKMGSVMLVSAFGRKVAAEYGAWM